MNLPDPDHAAGSLRYKNRTPTAQEHAVCGRLSQEPRATTLRCQPSGSTPPDAAAGTFDRPSRNAPARGVIWPPGRCAPEPLVRTSALAACRPESSHNYLLIN